MADVSKYLALVLVNPAEDGDEAVNFFTMLNLNWVKVDAAFGDLGFEYLIVEVNPIHFPAEFLGFLKIVSGIVSQNHSIQIILSTVFNPVSDQAVVTLVIAVIKIDHFA